MAGGVKNITKCESETKSVALCDPYVGVHAPLAAGAGVAAGAVMLNNLLIGPVYAVPVYFLGRAVYWACIKIMPRLDGCAHPHWFMHAYQVCAFAISFFAATALTWQAIAWTKQVFLALQWPIARSVALRTISLWGAVSLTATTALIALGVAGIAITCLQYYRSGTAEKGNVQAKAEKHEAAAAAAAV